MELESLCMPGAGLRPKHYPELEKGPPRIIKWFEIISENYMDSWGRPREILRKVRSDFPVAMHGVSMSLASVQGPSQDYLEKLKRLHDDIRPFILSDHLCWTGSYQHNTHDLLPFPYRHPAPICSQCDIHRRWLWHVGL